MRRGGGGRGGVGSDAGLSTGGGTSAATHARASSTAAAGRGGPTRRFGGKLAWFGSAVIQFLPNSVEFNVSRPLTRLNMVFPFKFD